jgi:hypothetical protein
METAHEFLGAGGRALLAGGGDYGPAYTSEFGKTALIWEILVRLVFWAKKNSTSSLSKKTSAFCFFSRARRSALFFVMPGACHRDRTLPSHTLPYPTRVVRQEGVPLPSA